VLSIFARFLYDGRCVKPWFVYIAECNDGSLYCGIAGDVEARIAKHDAGKGARYTRGRGPLVVRAVKKCKTHGDALRLEIAVKKLTREAKALLFEDQKRFNALLRRVRAAAKAR
jgi:putative endonuclease